MLENNINETFINNICEYNTNNVLPSDFSELINSSDFRDRVNFSDLKFNESSCYKSKKKFNSLFSKYNYNIIKLRTGISYSKNILENIENLFDDYNFQTIININKIQSYDEIINDKNIIDVYNKTKHKIIEINKESDILINEKYIDFLDEFKAKYSFKNDYLPFLKKFKDMLKFEDYNYSLAINNELSEIIDNIFSLIYEFNKTLIYQLSIKEKYTYYNFNQSYFYDKYNKYYNLIKEAFDSSRKKITNLNNNYLFNNSLKYFLSKLQSIKRKYIKNHINNYSKIFEFELLNISYNIGEKIEKVLEEEFNEYEFTFIYDYVEIFENFTKSYINKIIQRINSIQNIILEKFKDTYFNFLKQLQNNPSKFINIDFIESLKLNQTKCKNYINITEYNHSDYLINNINYIFSNCLDKNIDKEINNTIIRENEFMKTTTLKSEIFDNNNFDNNFYNYTLNEN